MRMRERLLSAGASAIHGVLRARLGSETIAEFLGFSNPTSFDAESHDGAGGLIGIHLGLPSHSLDSSKDFLIMVLFMVSVL